MKTYFRIALIGIVSGVALSVSASSDCIIDPQKVMVHASSEPLFIVPDEKAREIASKENPTKHYMRQPDEYLEVLKTIPSSEPKVQKAWLDYKIMKEE